MTHSFRLALHCFHSINSMVLGQTAFFFTSLFVFIKFLPILYSYSTICSNIQAVSTLQSTLQFVELTTRPSVTPVMPPVMGWRWSARGHVPVLTVSALLSSCQSVGPTTRPSATPAPPGVRGWRFSVKETVPALSVSV